MVDHLKIIDDTKSLPPQKRAAAIAHWIYIKTSARDKNWPLRVADEWDKLDQKAKDFNIKSIETWANEYGVFEAWVDAVKAYSEEKQV